MPKLFGKNEDGSNWTLSKKQKILIIIIIILLLLLILSLILALVFGLTGESARDTPGKHGKPFWYLRSTYKVAQKCSTGQKAIVQNIRFYGGEMCCTTLEM